jgi:hypothetical protein
MKLFKPVLRWTATAEGRSVTIEAGGAYLTLSVTANNDIVVLPDPSTISDPPPDPVLFSAAVISTLKKSIMMFLAGPDEHRMLALGAMYKMARTVFGNIEHTPRAAEQTLELFYLCDARDIPPHAGLILFGAEVMARCTAQESEYEKSLGNRLIESSPDDVTAALGFIERDMPPVSYEFFFPPVPQEALDAYARKDAAVNLATMPVGGSA